MRLHRPVSKDCVLTCGFGPYPASVAALTGRSYHSALDFAPLHSVEDNEFYIYAAGDGSVLHTGFNREAGHYIILSHVTGQNLIFTYYFHLDTISVFRGSAIKQGDNIGIMGSTGQSTAKHLHFAMAIVHLTSLQFVDPTQYFV